MTPKPDSDTPEYDSPDINIGSEIQHVMKQSHFSATWLAGRMCCDRSNIYKLLSRRSLDTATLYKISLFLHHDFFALYTKAFGALIKKNDLNSPLE